MKQYVINKSDLLHNIDVIRQKASTAKVIAVLKGNGYGIGLLPFAEALSDKGIDFFAVSEVGEGVSLRENGFEGDILLISALADEGEIRKCINRNIIMSVGSDASYANIASIAEEVGKGARVHIKVDTGFGRFGFAPDKADEVLRCIGKYTNIIAEGVYSHLSFSFSDKRKDVQSQFDKFIAFTSALEDGGVKLMRHICNSCAFMQYEDMHLDAVRVGSAFLGRLPLADKGGLRRIGKLIADVVEVKALPKGHFVGYANTFKTKRDTKIAVVPIGYKDGFGIEKSRDTFRLFDIIRYIYHDLMSIGYKHTVTIGGKSFPIIGRISMCNVVADVTGADIKPGDIAEADANPITLGADVERIYE